ncbi:40619_t:CDS:10 [Gigaspora margarita]|uniref:40619_t:CDS:1 n=1 Tax=Gigaspora margarita TaxID=4874 RepID=A0ABN7VAQ2_GIGMA|nr:40619_t:CDS:10 [Gigaspora margarita]
MSSVKWIVIKESLDNDINNAAAASNTGIEVEENDIFIEENAASDIQIEENMASNIHIEVKENATNLLYTKTESLYLLKRTGKSTLMNILAGVNDYDNEIFKTSPDMETVTTGVDISKAFVPLKEFSKLNGNPEINNNILVGFVDTEGQGNNGDEFDIYLFSPVLVTSKIVIFWWPGLLQIDTILNNLGAMTNCAKRIARDTQCQRQNSKPYGHLHIIFRSWNNSKTPEDVKTKLLEPQSVHKEKDKEHNSIRELLNDCFESIDIWLFPANGLTQCCEKLLFEDFNDKWKQTFKDMRKKFSDQLSVNKPKHRAEKTWTGRDISEFIQLLCKTLTSSENYAITSIFERMQVARAKTLANDALNEFRTLIDKMDPNYKPDDEGIDAYLYKELENFKEKLKLEKFSNKIITEIYANYKESACLIESEVKTNIKRLTIEVQNFQNKFDDFVSEIMFPLSKPTLKECCKQQAQKLWNSFNDQVKKFPKKLVHDYRKKLENFCKEKNKHIAAENEKKIITFVQNKVKENLEKSVKKLKNRFPMTEKEFESEWLVLLEQSKVKYFKLHHSFNNFPNYTTFPDNLHIIVNPFLELLTENNNNAWKNKAEAFRNRAKKLFKNALYTNFPVNAKKVFNNTEIEQYFQEEILRFSYKVSNLFPHTVVNNICPKYKETARLIVTKLQEKNNKNIREIPQKVERYILDWDILFKEINNTEQNTRGWGFLFQKETPQNVTQHILDWDEKSNELERWQHEVTELLLFSTTIQELVTISSFQLLCICNDLTNLNRTTDLSSFRKAVRSIMRSDMKHILSEQFVNEILAERVRSNLRSWLFDWTNWSNQSNQNKSLKINDLVTFAGVIAARLHYVRASREWTSNETRVANYLTREIENMNAPSVYKKILNKLILNSNSLVQLLINNEIGPNNNEVDEFLMKSVIVHLIILHASIPNDASPLAAYLHKLQVCKNDFILTCPSDVEGVVMNAVASFSKETGAEQGVVRYKCKCGEMFVVLDCGDFSNPEEQETHPTKRSISSKCLNCKRVIGYGSIKGDYTRMDPSQIKSVSINHEPGYIVELISTEKTHNVRMMTPQAYRILHLFVHTLLGASVPSSIATNFFAKNGNSADLLDESNSSNNASRIVPALEMLICSIDCKIDGETSIENYISQQMDMSILTENTEFCGVLRANLRLKHLISLYERVESVKAYNFDKLNTKYKKALSSYMEKKILNVTSFANTRSLDRIYSCDLLIALKRFLDRYLMVDSLDYISTENKLTSYITNENFSCWPLSSTLKIAKSLFPSKIQVGQTYSVYKLISSRQASSQSSV